MPRSEAANDDSIHALRPQHDGDRGSAFNAPPDHVGPLMLSDTGRMIWWTGRVAIGLRYEPPRHVETTGRSAEWIQKVLLRCG